MGCCEEYILAKKAKKLCKWDSSQIDKRWKIYIKLVEDPHCVCKKCGRAATDEKAVCKPASLK